MFNQYEPNIKAVISFLKILQVKVNNTTVNETMQNHPDYPSMLCISDSLNKWNIPNAAAKIEPSALDELLVPFIAHINDRENPLVIITEVNENSVTWLSKNYSIPASIDKEDFLKTWKGIYLIAEPTEASGEKDYKVNLQKAFINTLIPTALFFLLATLFFTSFYKTSLTSTVINLPAVFIQWILLFAGVIVTSLLLWYEVDKNNPVLQKVCTGIAKGNFNSILTGKQAKLFGWLSWSEVGFFYFAGGLLVLSFIGINSLAVLGWLGILALPYTIFSVYYQWRIAKQWCVLCLAVQALLLLGALNIFINHLLLPLKGYSVFYFTNILLLYFLPVLLWYVLKPFVLQLQQSKTTKREFLRIKFNSQIFETLLKKQKAITIPADGLGIALGNPKAANSLIKICNPYCPPCAKAHPKIEKLLEETPNLKAQIIFTTPNKPEHPAYEPVNHLMAIAAENDIDKTTQALDDWYLPKEKDYAIFNKKYPLNGELSKQGNKIEAMDRWCKALEIKATPTILINGYQLPDAYSIEDLQYFLLA